MNFRWLTSPTTFRARIFWSLAPIFLVLFALVAIANVQLHRSLAEGQFRQRGVEIATNLTTCLLQRNAIFDKAGFCSRAAHIKR